MRQYILAIDQGTTGSRAVVYDRKGRAIAGSYKEFRQYFPRPGWVEHNPDEIWQSVNNSLQAVLKKVPASSIAALGITNQRETTVIWDKETGRPIHNAIVWQCRRTAGRCNQLKKIKGQAEFFRKRTGLPIDAYFSATKIEWLLKNIPGAQAKARAGRLLFGTTDTWVLWKLTGGRVHSTDYTNASRTMLFNIEKLKWDEDILKKFQIPLVILPQVKNSSGIFGQSAKIGRLPAGIPISGIAGDQQAALFGQAGFLPGSIKNTYGTGCFILLNTGKKIALGDFRSAPYTFLSAKKIALGDFRSAPYTFLSAKKIALGDFRSAPHTFLSAKSRPVSKYGLITTLGCGRDGEPVYVLEGAVFIAGAAIQWLRDGLKILNKAGDSERMALSVKDNGGVYFVPAFVGLGAPYWDPDARGAVFGITRGTTANHLVRAALEAMCYQTKDVLAAMEKDTGLKIRDLRIDGGAAANNFLCQFQADILGVNVIRPRVIETTSLGAAYLAGLAVGYWKDTDEISKCWSKDKEFTPKMPKKTAEHYYQGWQKAVKKLL